jgi:hypothetical protein
LTACADQVQFGDPPFEPVEPAAVDAVSSAYTDCLRREAERIDDGKLSPIGLALKVIPACEKQFAALEAVAASGSGRLGGHAIRDNLEQEKEDYATRVRAACAARSRASALALVLDDRARLSA